MASPAAILRAAKAVPGGAVATAPPQGTPGWAGSTSPVARELASANSYANAYGPFLPRPSEDFTAGAFGPFSPILPVPVDAPEDDGRAGPRREQYEVGWNLPVGQPGTEGIKMASFQTLRTIADLYSVARAAIELRKDEIKGIGWDIVPTAEAAKAMRGSAAQMKDFGDRAAQAKKFFERPDPDYFTWSSWIGDVMEQMLVFDALSIWLAPKRGKGMGKGLLGSDLDCLQLIDGQTIRPLYNLRGSTPRPPAPAYQQYLYGVPRADLTAVWTGRDLEENGINPKEGIPFRGDQLLYLPYVKRRWTPYGFAPVERALLPIMAGLQKQGYALDFFREGTVPAVYISPGDSAMTPSQIRELQDALNAIAGDPAWHHKIIVLPPGSKTEPQRPAQLADQFDDVVMNWVCMAFSVMPMELGISPKVSTTMSPGASNQMAKMSQGSQERKATKPTLEYLSAICNYILHEVCSQEDMRFLFEGLEEDEDELTKTNVLAAQINVGLTSIDEGRGELGKQPWGLPETSDPVWASATGPVPLGQMDTATGKPEQGVQQPDAEHPAGAQQQPGQPGAQGQQGGQQQGQGQLPPGQQRRALPAAKPAPGNDGNAGQSPGHEAAEAAANTRQRTAHQPASSSGNGSSASASDAGGKQKAAVAELGSLARHLRKGRAITTWEPRHLPGALMASVSEDLAKGLSVAQAVDVARTVFLRKAGPPGDPGQEPDPGEAPESAASWPGWELDLALGGIYTTRIEAALAAAAAAAGDLIRRWWKGILAATRQGLIDLISDGIASRISGVLGSLWREAWHLGDRSARAVATLTGPDWGDWTPGDPEAAALVDTAAGLQRLLAGHGISMIRAISRTGMQDLADALSAAVASGDSADTLAAQLPAILRIPQRAPMIARTEIARAVSAATHDAYLEHGVSRREWAVAPDEKVCPQCRANEAAGAVPLGQPFPDGLMSPPGHPNCRCALLPAETYGIDLTDESTFAGTGKFADPGMVKVGPHGFIHGWIFVGIPTGGDRVYHPRHGHGSVVSHDGRHVQVKFDDGTHRSFAVDQDPQHARRLEEMPDEDLYTELMGRGEGEHFSRAVAEFDRRDQEAKQNLVADLYSQHPETDEDKDRLFAALVDEGENPEDAYGHVHGTDTRQMARQAAIAQLRQQGYKGSGFDELARNAFKDDVRRRVIDAENATNGFMLTPQASRAGIDPWSLFTGPESRARKHASSELKEWWDQNGRPTLSDWQDMLLGQGGVKGPKGGDFYA